MVKKPTATFAQDASKRLKKQTNLAKVVSQLQNNETKPDAACVGFFRVPFYAFAFISFFSNTCIITKSIVDVNSQEMG